MGHPVELRREIRLGLPLLRIGDGGDGNGFMRQPRHPIRPGSIVAAPKPTGPLNERLRRAKLGAEHIKVDIQRRLYRLRTNHKHGRCLAILTDTLFEFLGVPSPMLGGHTRMQQHRVLMIECLHDCLCPVHSVANYSDASLRIRLALGLNPPDMAVHQLVVRNRVNSEINGVRLRRYYHGRRVHGRVRVDLVPRPGKPRGEAGEARRVAVVLAVGLLEFFLLPRRHGCGEESNGGVGGRPPVQQVFEQLGLVGIQGMHLVNDYVCVGEGQESQVIELGGQRS